MAQVFSLTDPSPKDDRFIDNWEEYWMEMAVTVARKSKDPRCRVGAVIVREELVLSTGFNGLARNIYDDPDLLADAAEKLTMICHAEQNAIFNAARLGVALQGATIYVTKFPCLGCCNAIIQAGVRQIYTHDTKYWDDDPADSDHSRKKSVLRQARIKVSAPFHPNYAPRSVTGKPHSAPGTAPMPSTSKPELAELPAPKRKKGKRAKQSTDENMSLFPGRHAIRGGKSEA